MLAILTGGNGKRRAKHTQSPEGSIHMEGIGDVCLQTPTLGLGVAVSKEFVVHA